MDKFVTNIKENTKKKNKKKLINITSLIFKYNMRKETKDPT